VTNQHKCDHCQQYGASMQIAYGAGGGLASPRMH
jgi:hypothetical protein